MRNVDCGDAAATALAAPIRIMTLVSSGRMRNNEDRDTNHRH